VDGRVLGTFGIYLRTRHVPTDTERSSIQQLANVAALAITGTK